MAGQWYGLPKLFPKSENLGYEVVKNDDTLIQFKNKQVSHFCNHGSKQCLHIAMVIPLGLQAGYYQCPSLDRPRPSH